MFPFVIGMIALAEVIADSKTILRMDLRENDPYVGGLMALSLSLKVNQSLVRIDLDKELKKEPVNQSYDHSTITLFYFLIITRRALIGQTHHVVQNWTIGIRQ